jgi:hypothetical protein
MSSENIIEEKDEGVQAAALMLEINESIDRSLISSLH